MEQKAKIKDDARPVRIRKADLEKMEVLQFLYLRATGKKLSNTEFLHRLIESEYNYKVVDNAEVNEILQGLRKWFGGPITVKKG